MRNYMRDNRKFIKDIIRVSISNIIKLMSGVLVGLLLPKIIGVTDYGFYKTYTLYIHYVGLFHFGISDGIYLLYGDKNYDQLDRGKFRFYSRLFICVEAVLSLILICVSLSFLSGENRFIFSCVAAYLLANNVTGYYQMISQITGRFKELSRRNVLQSLLISITVLAMYVLHRFASMSFTYRPYTAIYTIMIALLAVWYLCTYREITLGNSVSVKENWRDFIHFMKIGFPLTVANLCSTLILSLDRQFVNVLFDTDTYAVYAFAYNMLALVTTAVSAVSTVLYPRLKRASAQTLKENYSDLVGTIAPIVSLAMSIYFPLFLFVNWFLPKYSDSLPIFRIIFPGLIISSVITIIMHNYYKVIGINNIFFLKSLCTLIVSGIANYIAYRFFGTTASISIASIITMMLWYIYVEYYFVRKYKVKWKRNLIYIVTIMMLFYLITALNNKIVAFSLYVVVSCLVTFIFYKERVMKIIKSKIM